MSPLWEAQRQAERRWPQVWYERDWLLAATGIVLGVIIQGSIQRLFGVWSTPLLAGVATLAYGGAFVGDIVATHQHIGLKGAFEKRGLKMSTCEANPLLPAYPTLWQQIWSRATLFSLLLVPLIWLLPGIGSGAAALHGLAAAGNRRAYHRSLLLLYGWDAAYGRDGDHGEKGEKERQKSVLTLSERRAVEIRAAGLFPQFGRRRIMMIVRPFSESTADLFRRVNANTPVRAAATMVNGTHKGAVSKASAIIVMSFPC
jgi:hypothetical protein